MQKSKVSAVLMVFALVFVASNVFADGPSLPAPDASNSALLLSVGFGGLAFARKFFRK